MMLPSIVTGSEPLSQWLSLDIGRKTTVLRAPVVLSFSMRSVAPSKNLASGLRVRDKGVASDLRLLFLFNSGDSGISKRSPPSCRPWPVSRGSPFGTGAAAGSSLILRVLREISPTRDVEAMPCGLMGRVLMLGAAATNSRSWSIQGTTSRISL
jgi:hypothetical protein